MIHQLDFNGKDKVDKAIMRIQAYEPPEGYWLAFSGGKDSVVIKALADMAGVKYEAHYSVTGIDPPELVRFIKNNYSDVHWDIPRDRKGNRITMWSLILKKRLPPTRIQRFCCAELKESAGKGRLTITGVRWAESSNRKRNQGEATIIGKSASKALAGEEKNFGQTERGGVVLWLDNRENARIVEMCYKTHKTKINPIIDWSNEDVWEFIHEYNVPYCELYDQGYKRLGCVGCPMSSRQKEELEKYPRFKKLYIMAFDKMLDAYKEDNIWSKLKWNTGQDIYDWWVNGGRKKNLDPDQVTLEEVANGQDSSDQR